MSDDRSVTAPVPALTARGLRLAYGDLTAVWNVDLDVFPGRTTALLGRNGAGKTTLLSGLIGLLAAKDGSVRLHGEDITGLTPWRRSAKGLSIVQEGKRVFRSLSVEENLHVSVSRRASRGERRAALDAAWERFPVLASRRSQLGGELSGGQQQMLSIATALVSNPSVVLIDEPSSGLAPVVVDQVLALIDTLKTEGLAILLVEQVVDQVLDGYADDVMLLDQGRILLSDAVENVDRNRIGAAMFGDAHWTA